MSPSPNPIHHRIRSGRAQQLPGAMTRPCRPRCPGAAGGTPANRTSDHRSELYKSSRLLQQPTTARADSDVQTRSNVTTALSEVWLRSSPRSDISFTEFPIHCRHAQLRSLHNGKFPPGRCRICLTICLSPHLPSLVPSQRIKRHETFCNDHSPEKQFEDMTSAIWKAPTNAPEEDDDYQLMSSLLLAGVVLIKPDFDSSILRSSLRDSIAMHSFRWLPKCVSLHQQVELPSIPALNILMRMSSPPEDIESSSRRMKGRRA
jgi:hypothetical protein